MTSANNMNHRLRALRRQKVGIDSVTRTRLESSQQRPGATDMNQVLRDALAGKRRARTLRMT